MLSSILVVSFEIKISNPDCLIGGTETRHTIQWTHNIQISVGLLPLISGKFILISLNCEPTSLAQNHMTKKTCHLPKPKMRSGVNMLNDRLDIL